MTDYHKEFIRELHQMADRRSVVEVFGDAVGMMASALQTAIPSDRKAAEERYKQYAARYTQDEMQHMTALLSIVVNALDKRRESFLGPVLEDIGAAARSSASRGTVRRWRSASGRVIASARPRPPAAPSRTETRHEASS